MTRQPSKRRSVSRRVKLHSRGKFNGEIYQTFQVHGWSGRSLLGRARGNDLLEARIAAQRVPLVVKTQFAIRWPAWNFAHAVQTLQGEVLLSSQCVDASQISDQAHPIHR